MPVRVKADLHIHSCLSPCADLLMSPLAIVQEAQKKGLDIIALCDHNSAENTWAAVKAARKSPLVVIPGMEICSREEVHILGWFPSVEAALEVQAKVYGALPGENDSEKFGMQVIVDEKDEVVDFCPRLLIGATTLSAEDIVRVIKRAEGLAVASHIDREGFSLLGQLGFIPPGLKLDALEVSRYTGLAKARITYSEYTDRFPLVCNSDAHCLEDVGLVYTEFECEEASLEGIKQALQGTLGHIIL
jgi:PHP family Zn ribbon phosphoesterase